MKISKIIFPLLPLLLVASALAGCGSHGGDEGDGLIRLTGQAILPPSVAAGRTPAANAPFQVVDFQRSANFQQVTTGTTDANGGFDVTIVQSKIVAVIVQERVRVSGLISADPSEISKAAEFGKDFNGITDIACEAGVAAITDGSVSPDDFSSERIANLELGAQVFLQTNEVNYFDPAAVTAAAAQVRQLTDDGDHPPL